MNTKIELPSHSRVWIYQADRQLSVDEKNEVEKQVREFIGQWDSHGSKIFADFEVLEDRFVVIAADEGKAEASGCSIDKSVGVMRNLHTALNIDFLDKTKVLISENGETTEHHFTGLKSAVENGSIKKDSLVYDLNVTELGDFREKWPKPVADSWLSRYF